MYFEINPQRVQSLTGKPRNQSTKVGSHVTHDYPRPKDRSERECQETGIFVYLKESVWASSAGSRSAHEEARRKLRDDGEGKKKVDNARRQCVARQCRYRSAGSLIDHRVTTVLKC